MKAKVLVGSAIVVGLALLGLGGFIGYVSTAMRPQDTGQVAEGVWAVRDGFVTFFVVQGDGGYVAFDAGNSPESAAASLSEVSINPDEVKAVFFTHSDSDHSGGLRAFAGAVLYLPRLEEPMVLGKDSRRIFGMNLQGENPLASTDYRLVGPDESVQILGLTVQLISTPGHSPGSSSYVVDDRYAFVGDMAVIGRGRLKALPGFINNDTAMAGATARDFFERYRNLDIIATAHDGVLFPAKD